MTAAAVAAGAVVAGHATQADAAIVYSGPQSIVIPQNGFGIYIDMETGTTTGANVTGVSDVNFWNNVYDALSDGYTFVDRYVKGYTPNSSAAHPSGLVSAANDVAKLALGAPINGGATFTTLDRLVESYTYYGGEYGPYGNWAAGNTAYAGFKFHNVGDTLNLFGWAQLNIVQNADKSYTTTILGWAYEDTGAPINAGDTGSNSPEPGSLSLLAIGAMGMANWRNRGKKKALVA